MRTSKTLCVIALAVATLSSPSHATSDRAIRLAAPQWVDETIYRPDCPPDADDGRSRDLRTLCDGCRQW